LYDELYTKEKPTVSAKSKYFINTSLVYPIYWLKYSKYDLNLDYIDFVVEVHNHYFYNEENETTLGESF